MSLTIETATMRIGRKIQETESLAEETAKSAVELYGHILEAGGCFRGHEAARFAQPALLRAHKALGDLTTARGELARAHAALLDARRIAMSPAEDECPPWGPTIANIEAAAS
tara:strand:+ start:797 stop:1132 length:336 start_codon:yes stop_codon:yes gene_type:complete